MSWCGESLGNTRLLLALVSSSLGSDSVWGWRRHLEEEGQSTQALQTAPILLRLLAQPGQRYWCPGMGSSSWRKVSPGTQCSCLLIPANTK